jgi:hypothetical protein
MLTIEYKRSKLAFQAIGCFALAAGGGWLAFEDWVHWQIRGLGGFLALCLPFVGYAVAYRAHSGQSAIVETATGLQLSTLYGSRDVRWQDLTAIERVVLRQSSAFGLIKQDIANYLMFSGYSPRDGEFRVKIQEDLIDVPKAGLARLYEQLHAMWQDGGSPRPVPATRLHGSPVATRATGFGRRGL